MIQPRDFGFGEDQEMIRDSAKRFLDDKTPLLALREATKGTEDPYHGDERAGFFDNELWQEVIALGWTSLAVPEEAGGAGMSLVTAVGLAEEIGRAAIPTPLTTTLQTTYVLNHAGATEWLKKIAEGRSATLATQDAAGSFLPDYTEVKASGDTLTGTACFVQDLQKADFLVVVARDGDTIKLYAVDTNAEGVEKKADRIVDLTRDQGSVTFNNVDADCISDDGATIINAAMPAILTLIAADMSGACEWLLQSTAEYATYRTQFDRPIGFFQAVKHPVVNMMIAADETRSLTYAAACAYDTEPGKAALAAHLAKSSASDCAEFCANRATQLHGGIGFTWEHDVQIYHKRLIHSQLLYGDGIWHREQAAPLL